MGEAIGQMLPAAVGAAVSPLPIVAVVLILGTTRGRTNGPAFLAGWFVALAIVGTIFLSISSGVGASSEGGPATWVNVVQLVAGLLLLLLGTRQWRKRPGEGEEVPTPKWMGALEGFGPVKATGAGALLSGANPKNLILVVAGVEAIAGAGISTGDQAIALALFVVIASLGVGAPVALYFALGTRSQSLLERLEEWLVRNNATIMAVLFLILGVKAIGDAISGFST